MVGTEKQKRIEDILKSGSVVVSLVVGHYRTEKQALAVEAALIHWGYGRETLTNDQSGHGCLSIRPKNNYSILQGIDEPELGYCERREEDRERNDVIGFLSEIRDAIERECNFKFDGFDTHNPRHTYLYKIYKGVKFTVVSRHTSRRAAAVTIPGVAGDRCRWTSWDEAASKRGCQRRQWRGSSSRCSRRRTR